jgi:2-amino-4-hydroxy-6-hydroxymethyldihydropteridine diphosphokinase
MRAVLSLGSNLGNSAEILSSAAEALNEVSEVIALSSFYQTRPVGGPPQPDFINAVIIIETNLEPEELLLVAQAIEGAHGRERNENTVRWGPRFLDIDLIKCDEMLVNSPDLTIPHPRAHEREFVLRPWNEIDPAATLPGFGAISRLLESGQFSE